MCSSICSWSFRCMARALSRASRAGSEPPGPPPNGGPMRPGCGGGGTRSNGAQPRPCMARHDLGQGIRRRVGLRGRLEGRQQLTRDREAQLLLQGNDEPEVLALELRGARRIATGRPGGMGVEVLHRLVVRRELQVVAPRGLRQRRVGAELGHVAVHAAELPLLQVGQHLVERPGGLGRQEVGALVGAGSRARTPARMSSAMA